MLDYLHSSGVFSMLESNALRLEAMDLFDRCLAEGNPESLVTFIQVQIIQDPPRIDVLQDMVEDLHQRLVSLREHHFDARDRVLRTVRSDFQVDLSPLTPANALEDYHSLDLNAAVTFISSQNPRLTSGDHFLLRKLLEASLELASELRGDIVMTQILLDYVSDWLDALSATIGRQYWLHEWEKHPRYIQ
jgi:hypothetical protein